LRVIVAGRTFRPSPRRWRATRRDHDDPAPSVTGAGRTSAPCSGHRRAVDHDHRVAGSGPAGW